MLFELDLILSYVIVGGLVLKYERKFFNKYAYTIEICEVDQVVGQITHSICYF